MKHLVEVPVAFRDQLQQSQESGFGYHVASVGLKNGKVFEQVAVSEGCIIEVRGYDGIPFTANEIESIKVNHKRWNFRDRSHEHESKARAATA